MANQNNKENTKLGFIIAAAAFVGVIALALYLYSRIQGCVSWNQQQLLEEIKENKENIEQQKQENSDNTSPETPSGTEASSDNASQETEAPILAPDFTVYTRDGTPVKFSEKTGKPMIINFWATWCGPCQSEQPHFEKAYREFGDKIEFMMINPTDGYNDTHEAVDNFIKKHGYTFPVYYDTESEAGIVYGINAFPTTILIDENGYLLGGYTGALTEDMLYELTDILIG